MALWLVRAGKHGEEEQQFLDDGRIYLGWGNITEDLTGFEKKEDLRAFLSQRFPASSKGKVTNATGQIWAFLRRMREGDWVVLPSKTKPAIHVGEIKGPCAHDASASPPHYREVDWFERDVPRSNFDQDILYSFGAFMTICQIRRNDAERRVRAMAAAGWKTSPVGAPSPSSAEATDADASDSDTDGVDLEEFARDQIAKHIMARFQGHGMARLVEAILEAQGYTTLLSPPGPDKGVDILAGTGPLGFGPPRLCVQVKSGATPLDRPTLDQLIGAMQNFQADQGLLVSWAGYRSSVDREEASQYFRVRLWDRDDLIEQLLDHYDKLDDDIRAELPLKRIWTVTAPDEEG